MMMMASARSIETDAWTSNNKAESISKQQTFFNSNDDTTTTTGQEGQFKGVYKIYKLVGICNVMTIEVLCTWNWMSELYQRKKEKSFDLKLCIENAKIFFYLT